MFNQIVILIKIDGMHIASIFIFLLPSFRFILMKDWNMLWQVSIFFDIIFMCQRFVLYPNKKAEISTKLIGESTEPLVKTSDHSQPETV